MAELEAGDEPGRRCEIGCESWPDDDEFDTCPRCGQPTERYINLRPLQMDDALQLKAELDFEDFYAHEWEDVREDWLACNPEHDWRAEHASKTYPTTSGCI